MAISFSPEQKLAIEAAGANLLVSAAAGAGKTAVLVARILHLLDEAAGEVELRNLLVVTFTRAAAREMKDRIGEALRWRLEANPSDAFFQRQLALLDRTPISTLDSFCQELVRENFHTLGISPGFTVLDADETDLIRREAIEAVFESHYADGTARGAEFRRLVDTYGGRREDQNLAAEVRRVADFLRTTADPEGWKAQALGVMEPFEEKEGRQLALSATPWGAAFRDMLVERLRGASEQLLAARGRLTAAGVEDTRLASFLDGLLDAAESARSRLVSGELDGWSEALAESLAARMPSAPRGMDDDRKAFRARVKDMLIEPARKELKNLVAFEGRYTAPLWVSGVRATIPLVKRLFLLTDEVLYAFDAEKRRLGALDFNDLERLALRALQADPADPLRPGPVAQRYRDQFEHVLVDEYQDINELQDAILRLVSRQDDLRHRAPNLFAVGDVKQSIYGFRLADPDIFISAYQTFPPIGRRVLGRAGGAFRIDLPANYRCRRPIIDSVNTLFRRLMSEDLGGIEYNEPARLVCGRVIPPPPTELRESKSPDQVATEILLVEAGTAGDDAEGEENGAEGNEEGGGGGTATAGASETGESGGVGGGVERSAAEREACALAERLWRMMGRRGDGSDAGLWVHAEHPDFTHKGAHYRPARWSDVVILLRAVSDRAAQFCDALRRCGVPLIAPPEGGLLETLEGRDLLSTLRVLDNPCQDIPLAAHLRSPLCRFSDDDLARVRLFSPDGDFHDAVRRYAEAGEDEELRRACRAAMARIGRWRELARQSPVAEVIDLILDETGCRACAGALADGARREANLDAFRARAVQFDSFERRGLNRFLRFLDGLAESGADPAAGAELAPGENAVRVMSIHKSKGLEFPIVCVADLGHRFNMQDLYRAVVTDRKWLIGMKTPSGRRSVTLPSLSHEVVAEQRRRAMLAEELRLLYVAMTRAREHLILSAAVRNAREALERWGLWSDVDAVPLPPFVRLRAMSHLDWIGPATAGQFEIAARGSVSETSAPFLVQVYDSVPDPEELSSRARAVATEASAEAVESKEADASTERDELKETKYTGWEDEASEALDRILSPLPHPLPAGLRAKLSVTEVKRLWEYAHEAEDGAPATAAFAAPPDDREGRTMEGAEFEKSACRTVGDRYSLPGVEAARGKRAAAERGTLTHLVMQHLDFAAVDSAELLDRAVEDLEQAELIPAEARGAVDVEAIAWFLSTPVGSRFRSAPERLRRELPFTARMSASEVYRGLPEAERAAVAGEPIVVQGVIDCLVVEPEGLRVFDYKTDAVSGPALELRAAAYGAQLRLYARAAAEIFDLPVLEAALIFLHPREIRRVDL